MSEDPNSPFTLEDEMYRKTVRAFLDRELEPHWQAIEQSGRIDLAFWRKAGDAGLLGTAIPEEFGGPGASDLCGVILAEELGKSVGGATIGAGMNADLATRILLKGGSTELKQRWCPAILTGEAPQCLALTEPNVGSDATAITASAVRDGDHYVLNGQKTYISNGCNAHIIYFVGKTDPALRARGMSLFLVEATTPGISRRQLRTMGYPAYDAAEIFFDDVRVPAGNLLLGEGKALDILMSIFAFDRLEIAARALSEAEFAFQLTLDYVKQRKAFGQTVFEFQNTQFKLAEMKTELEVGRAFLHDRLRRYRVGDFSFADGAMLKLFMTEMSSRVMDVCMQLHGGVGFMHEMVISRLYRGNRLHRLYAGTSELQKVAIARAL
jgi:acyl-CoA dehydrogenase